MKLANLSLAAAVAVAGVLVSGAASAFPGYAAAHLNIRSGPGTQYLVLGQTSFNDPVEVNGCLQGVTWCSVTWNGINGWADANYIDYDATEGVKTLPQATADVTIPPITYTAVDAVTAGAIVGVVPTGVAPVLITPPPTVSAYVAVQPAPPVILTGEVVIGAVLPQTVPLYAVPQSVYQFAAVNGHRVLVENNTRQIVYIYP